jgi:hypothetical protein
MGTNIAETYSLLWKPNFISEFQEDIFSKQMWKKINIPWIYKNQITWEQKSETELNVLYWNNWKEYIWIEWVQHYEIVTKCDLINFNWLDDEWIVNLIQMELGLNINTNEWIRKMNHLIIDWLEFLDKIWKSYPNKYRNNYNIFNSKADIINFCKKTTKEKTLEWFMNCVIAKSIWITHEILSNEELSDLAEKEKFLIQKLKNDPSFTFTSENKWYLSTQKKKIYFSLVTRSKEVLSMIFKIWIDPKSYSSTEIKDWLWLTFYLFNKNDVLILMQYVGDILYEWEYEIKNKSFLTQKIIKESNSYLHQVFISNLWEIDNEKKTETSDLYSDVKQQWRVNVPPKNERDDPTSIWIDVGTEIKYDIYDSKNDDWLAFHAVYWHFKIINLKCRLYQWFVWSNDLNDAVEKFFFDLDEELEKKNKLVPEWKEKTREKYLLELQQDLIKNWYILQKNKTRKCTENELFEWLKKYYISKLLNVRVWWWKNVYYTTRREYNLSLAWIRPKMEIIN